MTSSGETAPVTAIRLQRIDALRCFAMTAVILQHCKLLPMGWTGVWLFYVVSGFVVTTSLLTPHGHSGWLNDMRNFFTRRARRIVPIYAAMVILAFVVSALITRRPEVVTLISYLLFFNDFVAPFGHVSFASISTGQLWTVSVEMQFYIIFGFSFFLVQRQTFSKVMLSLIVISPVLRLLASVLLSHSDRGEAAYIIYTASPLHFDAFAVGSLLALHREVLLTATWVRRLAATAFMILTIYVGFYVLLNLTVGRARGFDVFRNIVSGIAFGQGRQVWVYSVVDLAAVSLVAFAAAPGGRGGAAALLDWTPLRWIGVRSYGAYVYHAAVLQAAHGLLSAARIQETGTIVSNLRNGVVLFFLVYPVSLALAALSYRYIEQPIVRVGRRPSSPGPQSLLGI